MDALSLRSFITTLSLKYQSSPAQLVDHILSVRIDTKRSIRNHLFWITTVLIMIFVISAAGVPVLGSLVAWTGLSNVSISSEAFLTSIVQAVATILAIQFSVSILAVQYASTNYSPSILERYGRNPKVIYAYMFEAATLIFSTLALFGERSQAFFLVSFVMFLSTLVYLFGHFSLTLGLVNPKSVISSLEHDEISRINSFTKPPVSETKLRAFFQRIAHARRPLALVDSAILETSRNTIISSVNILQKSTIRRDYETSVAGFQSLASMSDAYVRATRQFVRPNDVFITFLLEQLYSVSKVAFDNPDLMILREAARAIQLVGKSSIALAPSKGTTNFSTKLCIHYLGEIGTQALVSHLNDVVTGTAEAISSIGSEGLERVSDDSLAPVTLGRMGVLASTMG